MMREFKDLFLVIGGLWVYSRLCLCARVAGKKIGNNELATVSQDDIDKE